MTQEQHRKSDRSIARLRTGVFCILLFMSMKSLSGQPLTGEMFFDDFSEFSVATPAVDPLEEASTLLDLKQGRENAPHRALFFRRTVSPWIPVDPSWMNWIVSWNVKRPPFYSIPSDFVEIRLEFAKGESSADSHWSWGRWTLDPDSPLRGSRPPVENEWGRLSTDTLALKKGADRVRIEVIVCGSSPTSLPELKNLTLSWSAFTRERDNNKKSLPKVAADLFPSIQPLDVPPRSQLYHAEGSGWCSPTSTAMVLDYWSRERDQPDWLFKTPEAARRVWDPVYKGTGNWPFNTAFAGSLSGMRSFVGRLPDLDALADWLNKGIPVVVSVDYSIVLENGAAPSGHLMVCVGMDPDGSVWLNDPGTRYHLRRQVERVTFLRAWAHSKQAAYFIFPEDTDIPEGYLQKPEFLK